MPGGEVILQIFDKVFPLSYLEFFIFCNISVITEDIYLKLREVV